MYFIATLENRFADEQFEHDASEVGMKIDEQRTSPGRMFSGDDLPRTPHVDRSAINSFAHQQFRTTVPESDDSVGVVVPFLLVVEPSQTEVCQFQYTLAVEEDI